MKKIIFIFLVLLIFIPWPISQADEIEDLQRQIDKLSQQLEMSRQATRPLESTLTKLRKNIASLRYQIKQIKSRLEKETQDLSRLELGIRTKEEKAQQVKEKLYQEVVYNYRLSRSFSPLTTILSFGLDKKTLLALNLEENFIIFSQRKIKAISRELIEIKKEKQSLIKRQKSLDKKKKQLSLLENNLNKQAAFYQNEIAKAKNYQSLLEQQITKLSQRQKELLAQKTTLFTTTVGEVPLSGDPHSRPDYNPGFSPAFAVFSFGAPHHKGMSQYGAFGRAKEGQKAEEILKAYYGNVRIESVNTAFSISTDQGRKAFENDYMLGIAEMPSKWADEGGFEALKAQAIAARSYALAYVGWRKDSQSLKGTICTSQHCQVYKASKAANPGRWRQAVEETKGQILVDNSSGEIINAWYSSTSGGYMKSYSSLGHSTPSFWDTKCRNQGCWPNEAYEKIAGSPWFYKGWYKDRYGKSCGRTSPWLTEKEMADVLNAALVMKDEPENEKHIYQTDGCLANNSEAWSVERMAQEADKLGGRVTSISSISVKYSSSGYTSLVEFETNRGHLIFKGDLFKLVFNLRAPGAIHIASSLYNIARK